MISSITVTPASGNPGSSASVAVTVKNNGTGAAAASTTRIRLAASTTITTSDPLLDTFTAGGAFGRAVGDLHADGDHPERAGGGQLLHGGDSQRRRRVTESNGYNNQTTTPFTVIGTQGQIYNTAFLTDAQLTASSTLTATQIRSFLASQGSYFATTVNDVDGVSFDLATTISQAASQYQINPEVLLTTLQKESVGVTTSTRPSDTRMSLLMAQARQVPPGLKLLPQHNSSAHTRTHWRLAVQLSRDGGRA